MAAMRRVQRESARPLQPARRAVYPPRRLSRQPPERRSALMLPSGSSYEQIQRAFRWRVPERYNIGVDVADRQALRHGDRLALLFRDENHFERRLTFREVTALSNRFANVLVARGLKSGDRIAVLLPQTPETAIAHIA